VAGTRVFHWQDARLVALSAEAAHPDASAIVSGVPYALVAFFSVFLFMFEGRSATFAGVVNRITSLLAGTVATLILALAFHLPPPRPADWVSLAFVLVAVALLARVERRRAAQAAVEAQTRSISMNTAIDLSSTGKSAGASTVRNPAPR
jgi:hypothetical protein